MPMNVKTGRTIKPIGAETRCLTWTSGGAMWRTMCLIPAAEMAKLRRFKTRVLLLQWLLSSGRYLFN